MMMTKKHVAQQGSGYDEERRKGCMPTLFRSYWLRIQGHTGRWWEWSKSKLLANMLLSIANRANMWVWLTMLAKFNKCWATIFDVFFLPQHVHAYNKPCQHVGQHIDQQCWLNVGQHGGTVCEGLNKPLLIILKTYIHYLRYRFINQK